MDAVLRGWWKLLKIQGMGDLAVGASNMVHRLRKVVVRKDGVEASKHTGAFRTVGRPKNAAVWYEKAAELMVRQGLHLRQAALEVGTAITQEETLRIGRTKEFQKVLWAERRKYYQELADNPERTKITALGRLELIIERLLEEGEWEKAAEVQLKSAKIAGWVGPEGNVTVFAGLSDKELQEVKRRVQEIRNRELAGREGGTSTSGVDPASVN